MSVQRNYSQRILTPVELEDFEEQELMDKGDVGLTDLGIDYNRQEKLKSRSQWAPMPQRVPRPQNKPQRLTRGPSPIYFNPGAYAEDFTDQYGNKHKGEPNIFPPNRQGDLPRQFAPMPVGVNEVDRTSWKVQQEALEAFHPNPYPAPLPVSPNSPPPSLFSGYSSPGYASADAHKGVVDSIGDWLGSMGKGGKTRTKTKTKKNKRKRKTNRNLKSKKGKKSRRR